VETSKNHHILNLGAGVQSTALYPMFLDGESDSKLDFAVFANTQEEPEGVYKHLEWLKAWAARRSSPTPPAGSTTT
jgi:hypothetical protein